MIPFLLIGCGPAPKIELGFSASEVLSLELYRYSVPAEVEMKIVTKQEDIKAIMHSLTETKLKRYRKVEETGSNTLSFRFQLSDGTTFEVIYTSHGVKKASIRSSYAFEYTTTSDIGAVWDAYEYEIQAAEESKLPVYDY